ncbi:MAG: Ig-like domain-containing protein, partial [Planctomycetota bacterium]
MQTNSPMLPIGTSEGNDAKGPKHPREKSRSRKQRTLAIEQRRRMLSEKLEMRQLLAGDVIDITTTDAATMNQDHIHAHFHFPGDGHDHTHPAHQNLDDCGGCGCVGVHTCGAGGPVVPHSHSHSDGPVYDISGNAYFADPQPILAPDDMVDDSGTGPTVPVEGNVPQLNSKPGADQTLFLDFDGHIVRDTLWNRRNNNLPIHAAPYSTDGDTTTYTASELNRIEEIFRRVAEDFAPFDVNVSTVDPGLAAFTAGGVAVRTIISTDVDDASMGGTGNRWYSGAGGVAYLGSFNWRNDTPTWVFENNLGNGNEKSVAEATSHEIGHAFGLSHDGNSVRTYYTGHGSGATAWAPIMGVGYSRPVVQWSNGQYNDANNQENDIAVIAAAVGYERDLAGDDRASAADLVADDAGVFDIDGLIERPNDIDFYSFSTDGGEFDLTATTFDAADGKSNLDIGLTLLDAGGNVIASSSPANILGASLNMVLDAGSYYVGVDGVGVGDPLGTGYDDYGSLGWFTIAGNYVPSTDGGGGGGPVLIDFIETPDVTYGGGQDRSKDTNVPERYELNMAGNTWRQVPVRYTVTENTVLEFEFASTDPGEIHGIGLDNDNGISSNRTFNIYGSQNWGYRDAGRYTGNGEFQSFKIRVGDYYTGEFDRVFFVNDDDAGPSADGKFKNVQIYEEEITNTDPIAVNDSASVPRGSAVSVNVLANDSDSDGDTLTIESVGTPSNGSAEIRNGRVVYTPNTDYTGFDQFTYTINDGRGGTATANVEVEVTAVDDGVIQFDENNLFSNTNISMLSCSIMD